MRQLDYDTAMYAKALIYDGYALVATAGDDSLVYFRHADRDIKIVALKQLKSEKSVEIKLDMVRKLNNVYYEECHLVDEVHKLVNVVKVMTKEQAKEIFIDNNKGQVSAKEEEKEL